MKTGLHGLLLFAVWVLAASAQAQPGCMKLLAFPGKVVSWPTFVRDFPPYSIALDGFVSNPPARDPQGPRAAFDHHTGVDRIATRSTAEQVYMEINLGLMRVFRKDGQPYAFLYVNDCDEDVCTATWLLQNHERVEAHAEPLINRLASCGDKLDCTGGTYPLKDDRALRERTWIFEPYQIARSQGRLAKMSGEEMAAVIKAVGDRISLYTVGRGEELPAQTAFDVVGGGSGWSFIDNAERDARMVMAAKGIHAYVLRLSEGRYTIGRLSEWIAFPLTEIFEALNRAEPQGLVTEDNRWGGSGTIGGSPRATGTKLSASEISKIIDEVASFRK